MLAASSAGVCATLGAGKEHTQVSARAEINRKNARCMVVPLFIDDALLAQACSFVKAPPLLERRRGPFSSCWCRIMRNAGETACAWGSERPTRGSTKCGATIRSLSVVECQKLRALLASFRPTLCDCHAAHPGIVDQSAACLSSRHRGHDRSP